MQESVANIHQYDAVKGECGSFEYFCLQLCMMFPVIAKHKHEKKMKKKRGLECTRRDVIM